MKKIIILIIKCLSYLIEKNQEGAEETMEEIQEQWIEVR